MTFAEIRSCAKALVTRFYRMILALVARSGSRPATDAADSGMLASIDAAITAGVNTVEYAGRAVVFASTAELVRERDRLRRLLMEESGD